MVHKDTFSTSTHILLPKALEAITLPQYTNIPEHVKGIGKIIEPFKKNKDVISIYLFDSYVRGMEKPFSEIDICVIADKDADRDKMLSHSSKNIQSSSAGQYNR
ncbi:MAG: hypothetical protein C4B59_05990 [Candidatus Methanogaster sp.]|uniref:Uncharacterized protein n=1 Tax=Candidatus Methanogaster sp. TaxID=3386292 RepID=A0AC61L466_9EURY|nr:MAG: hypothetical protein C4B59_05990 [ANME-2 cluster archaeon]